MRLIWILFWNAIPEALYVIVAGFMPDSSQTGAVRVDDGVNGAAAAGVGSVRRLFLLWDCRRRIHHHSPGDFTQKLIN